MSSAHVKLVMHNGGAGNKICDHGKRVGAVGPRDLRNLAAAYQAFRR